MSDRILSTAEILRVRRRLRSKTQQLKTLQAEVDALNKVLWDQNDLRIAEDERKSR